MTESKTTDRRFVRDRLQSVSAGDFSRTIKELIVFLDELEVKHSGYQDLCIEAESGYDEETNFFLYGMRPETDKEQERRINKAERARISYERVKAKREAKEKATLAELKQKYEVAE